LLAWRKHEAEVAQAIVDRGLRNVEVRAGRVKMEEFYAEVDAMILPFATARGNHGCPLSAVEGMLRGKPVLLTDCCGIAAWVEGEGAGVEAAPAVDALRAGLGKLQKEILAYSQQAHASALQRFDPGSCVAAYRRVFRDLLEQRKGPPLEDWQRRLAAKGKQLVRGRAALAAHYAQREVAANYTTERFASQPASQVEYQERQAISELIRERFGGRGDLKLLDLATGPGRLIPALLPFGSVTALDGSVAMLEVARQRNFAGVQYILGDIWECPFSKRFHVVTCGRFLRHLEYPDRRVLYRRFHDLLRNDGVAIVDVPNPPFEHEYRDLTGWESFPIYDVFWRLQDFRTELLQNGLRLAAFRSVGARVKMHPAQQSIGLPGYHMVAFQRLDR
ncbi:MAG: methyltransferase domain-containing protein, partial [Bryobacteraceae bacterium]